MSNAKIRHMSCLGNNISKYFSVDNMKNTGLYRYSYDFSVDYDSNDVPVTLDIDKYSMFKNDTK